MEKERIVNTYEDCILNKKKVDPELFMAVDFQRKPALELLDIDNLEEKTKMLSTKGRKISLDYQQLFLELSTSSDYRVFETPSAVTCYSNTGGFGIDGGVSALLGMSLADKQKLCFGVVGDLGFFYDMNALGNRHVGNNLRLMLINNGRGTEFRNYNHPAARFGEDADPYMAAAGHYGAQSPKLVKHYAEDLGFEYMSASNKEEYLVCVERFLTPGLTDRPMVFEVFTDSQCESDAIETMNNLEVSMAGSSKQLVKKVLGDKGVQAAKKILRK